MSFLAELMVWLISETLGRSGRGLGENCATKVSANCLAYSFAAYINPLEPASEWVAGYLLSWFLFSL